MASATPVTDHEEIREWVESRGGRPACVKGTAALLRVDFGEPDEKLQPVEWEQWFETFDSRNLAALIQEGGASRFIKLVSRDSAGTRGGGGGTRGHGRKKSGRYPRWSARGECGRGFAGRPLDADACSEARRIEVWRKGRGPQGRRLRACCRQRLPVCVGRGSQGSGEHKGGRTKRHAQVERSRWGLQEDGRSRR